MRLRLPHLQRHLWPIVACCTLAPFSGSCSQAKPQPAPVHAPPPPVPQNLEEYDSTLVVAIHDSVEALEAESSDPEGWLRLGKLYEAHQLHDYAVQAYEQAVALAGDNPKAWYRLAISRSKRGDLPTTLEAFEAVHRLAPDYAPAWRREGRFLLEMGHPIEAGSAFAQALKHAPSDTSARLGVLAIALEEGDADAALAGLDSLGKVSPGEQALWHRLRGRALAQLGREAEAEVELAKGRGARPGGSDPWSRDVAKYKVGESALVLRTDRLLARGQVNEALALLRPLEEKGTDDVRVWRRLGSVYTRLGKHRAAARSLERACFLEPHRAKGWLATAVAQRAAGMLDKACKSSVRAFELDPSLASAALLRADLLLGTGQHQEVVDLCDKNSFQGRDQAELLAASGKACVELQAEDEALLRFEKALALCPELPDPWAGTALVHLRAGRAEPARQAIEALRKLAPDHSMLTPLEEALASLITQPATIHQPR